MPNWSTLISFASGCITLGTVAIFFSRVHRWFLRQEAQDADIRSIKQEQQVLTHGVLACLQGLKEQGCDGPVEEAVQRLEKHLNQQAHK